MAGPRRWPGSRRTHSLTSGSTGATPCMTGPVTGRSVLNGGAAGALIWHDCTTWYASTILEDLHTYWSIPADAKAALEGHWEPGPGMALVKMLERVPGLSLIAEDLGNLDERARDFIAQSGLPGMKVLVYAFDPNGESAYLPHNCPRGAVMLYRHPRHPHLCPVALLSGGAQRSGILPATTCGCGQTRALAGERCAGPGPPPACSLSPPMQDLLGLGADARMNAPGTMGPENWSWRVRAEALNPDVSSRLLRMTRTYRRTRR